MNKIKIEIKNRWTGSVLFEYEKENNTIKDTLEEAIKQDADLRGANLRGAYLGGADLRGADLRDTNLRGADLRGANLRGADLGGADLRGADLRGANLRGAYLRGADLRDANLRGADLRDANLRGADLRGAYLYMWDNDNVNIKEIIENLENNSNLKIKSYYINKHILSPVSKFYWKNGLIIDEYEIVDRKEETVEDKAEEKPSKIDEIGLFDLTTQEQKDNEKIYSKIDELTKAVNYLLGKSDKE